jgi:hypothetical protein
MRISTQRNSTLVQTYHDINKTNIDQYELTPVPIFPILYFIITLLITLCIDFPLLGIVSGLLHNLYYCITYCFSYVMHLRNHQKELYTSFYRHSHFSYLCSIKSSIFTPNREKKLLNSPLISSLRKTIAYFQ